MAIVLDEGIESKKRFSQLPKATYLYHKHEQQPCMEHQLCTFVYTISHF